MSSTMIAAGRRVNGVETRQYAHVSLRVERECATSRGTPTYTVASTQPFTLLMSYDDTPRPDVLPVYYHDGAFVSAFILWCDCTVTAYNSLTGAEIGVWYGAAVERKQEVA